MVIKASQLKCMAIINKNENGLKSYTEDYHRDLSKFFQNLKMPARL